MLVKLVLRALKIKSIKSIKKYKSIPIPRALRLKTKDLRISKHESK